MIKSLIGSASMALLLACVGCAGADPNSSTDGSVSDGSDALRVWHQRRPPVTSTPTAAPAPASTSSASAAAAPAPAATDASSVIAAAQTADGQAIPQASGPDGSCPPVVVLLGFWACVTLGDTCSFNASGATHDCTCDRTDGEGQGPSWVCN